MRQILLVIAVAVLLPTVCLAEQYLAYPFDANYDVPVKYFDPYPGFPTYSGHEGTDFACPYYTALYAPIAGQVTIHDGEADGSSAPGCTEAAGFGNYIIISSGTRRVRLAHCANGGFTVANGSSVTQGQLVAHSSNSGYTCGNDVNGSFYHLHLQLDLWEDGQWVAKNPYVLDGGVWITPRVYGGSITPTYSVTWQEQFPAYDPGMDALYLQPNETVACGLKVFNGSNVALSNDGNSEWYVELHSVSSAYNQDLASPLADAGWLTTTHIVSSNTICTPQTSTWYYFNIHTPSTPGTYWLYMRLYRPHDGYGFLGQTGWNMKVVVTDPTPPPPDLYAIGFVGDFNGDGKCDVGQYSYASGNVYVALRNTTGTAFIASSTPWITSWVASGNTYFEGDFNGDGKCDIGAYSLDPNEHWVCLSDGTSHFTYTGAPWIELWAGAANTELRGDFNGDGKCDLGSFSLSPNKHWVALSTGNHFTYTGAPWIELWAGAANTELRGDFNGDGKCDLLSFSLSPNEHWVAVSNGTNHFTYTGASWITNWAGATNTEMVGDFNDDGKSDLIAYSLSPNAHWIARNTGTNHFVYTGAPAITSWAGADNQEFVGDFNGDGYDDLASFNPLVGTWWVALNQHNFTFAYDGQPLTGLGKVSPTQPMTLPKVLALAQNYPNPFNPVTTISYSLPEATHVTLKIYNILGQRVATLVNHEQEAGDHTVNWNAGKYSSGIYFYRLRAGEATETKKMVLLK